MAALYDPVQSQTRALATPTPISEPNGQWVKLEKTGDEDATADILPMKACSMQPCSSFYRGLTRQSRCTCANLARAPVVFTEPLVDDGQRDGKQLVRKHRRQHVQPRRRALAQVPAVNLLAVVLILLVLVPPRAPGNGKGSKNRSGGSLASPRPAAKHMRRVERLSSSPFTSSSLRPALLAMTRNINLSQKKKAFIASMHRMVSPPSTCAGSSKRFLAVTDRRLSRCHRRPPCPWSTTHGW